MSKHVTLDANFFSDAEVVVINPISEAETKKSLKSSKHIQRMTTAEERNAKDRSKEAARDHLTDKAGGAQPSIHEAKMSTVMQLLVSYFQQVANILKLEIPWPTQWFKWITWVEIGSLGLEFTFDGGKEAAYWLIFCGNLLIPLLLYYKLLECRDEEAGERWHQRYMVDWLITRRVLALMGLVPASVLISCGILLKNSISVAIGTTWAVTVAFCIMCSTIQRTIYRSMLLHTNSRVVAYQRIAYLADLLYLFSFLVCYMVSITTLSESFAQQEIPTNNSSGTFVQPNTSDFYNTNVTDYGEEHGESNASIYSNLSWPSSPDVKANVSKSSSMIFLEPSAVAGFTHKEKREERLYRIARHCC